MPDHRDDHYFSAEPASPEQRRTITVHLAGRDLRVHTTPGIFSPGHVDLGTQVLLRTVPPPPDEGELVDLGCGWGPLALTLALRAPAARVWAVDVNRRALDALGRTARDLHLGNLHPVGQDAVPEVPIDLLWSNPPIRIGKAALHALLRHWLGRLAATGSAYLVVQRNLGADSLHRWLEEDLGMRTERVASAKGFRVLHVRP